MTSDRQVDLTNCDREPIHIPGSIQPFGCLLACDASGGVVRRHSLNAREMLGISSTEINGKKLDELLGKEAAASIREALARSEDSARAGLLTGLRIGKQAFNVAVHRHKGVAIIELEPLAGGEAKSPLELARTLIGKISPIDDIDVLLAKGVKLVRNLLGYDRVMIYRFAHDGSGRVEQEAKRSDLEGFLGQHFPASDIPQQARALYLKNTIRSISDASGQRVAIEPELDASGEPLDLSYANLRSVSPIHLEYLRNMGVGASMSISIIVEGKFWGLIACHHYGPRVLPMAERVAAEMFGEFFSLHLEALTQKQKLNSATEARKALDRTLQQISHQTDMAQLLRDNIEDFRKLMPCDGVGIFMDDKWTGTGLTPPESAIPRLVRFVNSVADGQVWASHALSEQMPAAAEYAEQVSGALVIPLSQLPRDYLFFFRQEVEQTIDWAGNPEKTYETGPMGDRLTPRKSFDIWRETVERQSMPFTQSDRDIAEAARAALVEIVLRHNELLSEERQRGELRQKMLNEELNHRVKNILALIKSLVSHPVAGDRSIEDYASSLRGRIQALAFAHDQVVRGAGGGGLEDLLKAELSPYRDRAGEIALEGPEVALDGRAFSVMALILHEMATNAAKYGALSADTGRLEVSWRFVENGGCEINWNESGGPRVSPPSRQGFGTVIVKRSVPFDLSGESSIDYAPEGVKARFLIPAKFVSQAGGEGKTAGAASLASAAVSRPLQGLSVLVVEDQLLIAMDVEAMLAEEGVANIMTAASASEALRLIGSNAMDAAVLDVNLGRETSMEVAEKLTELEVPFVFATGYGDSATIPMHMSHIPVVRKPYDSGTVADAVTKVLTGRPSED